MPGFWKRCCGCVNCEFTARDVLLLSIPYCWTLAACFFLCYYTVHPLINNQFPKTIPLYWSFISAFPSLMTALNIFLFHLDSVKEKGMSRASINEVSQVIRLLSLGGIGFFIIMATASAVQLAKCLKCQHLNYGESVAWFITASIWIIIMAVTSPRPGYLDQLIFKYDTNFQQPTYAREGPYIASDGAGEPCAYDWYGSAAGVSVVPGHPDGTIRAVGAILPTQGAGIPDVVPGKVKGASVSEGESGSPGQYGNERQTNGGQQ